MNIFDSFTLDTEIIPGILEKDWKEIERKIELIKPFAKVIHIDLLDGKFAPNITYLDPAPFAKYASDIAFELHMMVEEPIKYLNLWGNAGFIRFIGQVEKMSSIPDFVAKAEDIGDVGLAIDIQTPVHAIEPFIGDIDVAFIMTVKAGFSRQTFTENMLEKVRTLRALDKLLPIEIDGGVHPETLKRAKQAGATRFVSTGFLFDGTSCQKQYDLLQKAANEIQDLE